MIEAPADASVTILCQNEAARIGACLASVAASAAAGRLQIAVSVFVNGSSDDSAALAAEAARVHGLDARIYTIAAADKANAINHAMGELRRPARLAVFADAYTVLHPGALSALAETLERSPDAQGVTGLAANGRTMAAASAATLAEGGRLNGQLHAFRPAFLDRMHATGITLPVGLYRGDSLLASMLCHDLDPRGTAWDSRRIAAAAGASFDIPRLSLARPADVARLYRRKVRQMRGLLENAAIKEVIYRGGYQALPDTADDMIAGWLAAGGKVAASPIDRPFLLLALRQHARAGRYEPESLRAVRLPH